MLKFVAVSMLLFVVYNTQAYDFSPEQKQAMQNMHDSCLAKTGANENDIVDFRNGKHNPVDSLKCYMRCILDLLGAIKPDGTFDMEHIFNKFSKEMKEHLEKVIEHCEIKGTVTCEFAYNLHECADRVDKEGLLLI